MTGYEGLTPQVPHVYGPPMDPPMAPIWTPYGPRMEPLWTPIWTLYRPPYGPAMDPLWILYGPPMDPLWNPYGPLWTPLCGPKFVLDQANNDLRIWAGEQNQSGIKWDKVGTRVG